MAFIALVLSILFDQHRQHGSPHSRTIFASDIAYWVT
jgi:hypothetical protein